MNCADWGTFVVFFRLQGIQKVDSLSPDHYHQKLIIIKKKSWHPPGIDSKRISS